MKIILKNLQINKVYIYKLIEDKVVTNQYVTFAGAIANDPKSLLFTYDVRDFKYIKISEIGNNTSATYCRFIDANGQIVGEVFSYTTSASGAETEKAVPTNAVKVQINDSYGGLNKSNNVTCYGKKR